MKTPRNHSSRRAALTRMAFRSILTAGVGLLGLAQVVRATDRQWVGGDGNFDDVSAGAGLEGWNTAVPVTGDNAINSTGANITVTDAHTVLDIRAGDAANATGTYTMTAGGSLTAAGGGWFRLGTTTGASGTFNLNGGTLTTTGQTNVSEAAGTGAPASTINLAGGTWNNTGAQIAVGGGDNNGNVGTGILNVSSGTLTSSNELWAGENAGSVGTVNVSGGTLNINNWIAVARNSATGTVNMTGGIINKAGGGNVTLAGIGTAQTATWNQTGGAFNVTTGGLWIGETATANYNISGGTVTATSIVIGQAGGSGTLTLQGATGTTGGLANGGGTEVVTGTTFTLGILGNGNNGTATVNLNGGTLSINTFAAGTSTGAKTINFNGGLLQANAGSATFLGGTAVTANVQAGGARISTNGQNSTYGNFDTIATVLAHDPTAGAAATDGGLTKTGAGVLTLSGANTYTGTTTISGGALDAQVAGSVPGLNTAGRVNVGAGGALVVGVGYSTGQTVGDIDTARASNTFAAGGSIGLDLNTGTNATYATNLTPTTTTDFYKLGGGTLTLTGANTYTGNTFLYGGLVNTGANNLGNGGKIVINGGGIQFATGNTTDYSARGIVQNGTATFDTNGNNVAFATAITGTGGTIVKQGLGTLTLSGGFTLTPTTNNLGNVFVQGGALTLSGATEAVNTGGNFSSIGQLPGNFGTLNVLNGATFTTTGDFNIADVGGGTATTPVNAVNGGIVNLSGTGSAFSGNSVFIGKGGNATTNGALATGVLNQSGGTFTATGNTQVGQYGQGQYNLSGGTFTHTGGFISVARFAGSFGMLDVTGTGVVTDTAVGSRTIIGEAGTGVLNVRNGGTVNANNSTTSNGGTGLTSAAAALTIGNAAGTTAAPTVGIVNLLPGGTINTQSIGSLAGAAAGTINSQLNLSGGTLKNTVATTTFIQNLTTANVYGNVGGTAVSGAVFDTTAGNATVAQPLLAPAGQGITSIAATGTSFATTPIVQITGGGGTGATAVATVDGTGNVTGFTITNPGIGYTAAPTVTVSGPSGTVVTTTANIGNNVSGGLTKLGINTLTLTGANTYTGVTTISAGTLALGTGGSIANSTQISVGTGTTFDVSAAAFTAGATQTINGVGTINAGAAAFTLAGTLSPGATTAAGDTGTLTIATTGTLTLAGTAITQFDIVNAATKDLINAPGAALNVNGTLAIRGTVTPGTVYTIASGLASETGNFASVTGVPANFVPTFTTTGTAGNLNYNVTFAVPEPSTWAMLAGGLGMAGIWLRRRRVA